MTSPAFSLTAAASLTQLHDFATLNENVFYVYNDIEFFKDEPQKVHIACEDDIHVSEEVYKRPMFSVPAYRLFTFSLFFLFYWPWAARLTRCSAWRIGL